MSVGGGGGGGDLNLVVNIRMLRDYASSQYGSGAQYPVVAAVVVVVVALRLAFRSRVQELCESRGGRPGLPSLISLWFCGRKATLQQQQNRSNVRPSRHGT